MIAPARVAAYDVSRAVGTGRADLPHGARRVRADAAGRTRSRAGRRDRHRHPALAGGVRSHRSAASPDGRSSKLDPEVLDILRLTMFQLLHLDRVPASAAVNDAVEPDRQGRQAERRRLVNAVLRRVSRRARPLPLPAPPADPRDRAAALAYLSVTLSHPALARRRAGCDRYGFEAAEAWARIQQRAGAADAARQHACKTTRDELAGASLRRRRA